MDEYRKRMFLILIHILEKHSVYVVGEGRPLQDGGKVVVCSKRILLLCCMHQERFVSTKRSVCPILEWSPISKNISRSRCNSSILTNLPQVSTHGLASSFGITVPNGVEEAFMIELSALRAALNREDPLALLTEQVDNGVDEGEYQDVLCALGQGAVKLVVGGNVGIGILQTGIHRLHRFLHGRHVFLGGAPRSESGNLRLQHFAHLRQIS